MTLSSPFLISPRAPPTTGIVSVYISKILVTSISKSSNLDNFSVNFAEVLLSDETAASMSVHLLSFLSLTTMSRLLASVNLAVLSYCSWLVFIVHTTSQLSRLHNLSRDLPMNVCCCLVMPINVLCFC